MKKLLKLVLITSLAVGPLAFAGGTNSDDPDPGFSTPVITYFAI